MAVAVSAICADTDEEADQLAASLRMAITLLQRGQLAAVPPVDKAERWLAGQGLQDGMPAGRRAVVGSPGTIRNGLEQVAHDYGADELLIVTITHDRAARRRSHELIADAFGLTPSRRPAVAALPQVPYPSST